MSRATDTRQLAAAVYAARRLAAATPAAATRQLVAAAAVACAAVLLAGPARAAIRPAYGGEAAAGAQGPLSRLDPALARSDAERLRAAAVACTLPDLLAAAPQVTEGGRVVRLRLRENLSFHDGLALRADDVVRSLLRLTDPAFGAEAAWRLLAIRGVAGRLQGGPGEPAVRATGPLTLEVELEVPGVDLLDLLHDPRLPVQRADGTGCGPFRPAPDGGGHLVPFDRHPAGRPFLDRLTVVPLPSTGGERALDVAGVDLAIDAAARRRGGVEGAARHATFLRLTPRGPVPTGDLRLGLDAAVDRDALVRFLVGGGARPLQGLLPAATGASAPESPERLLTGAGRMVLAYDAADPIHRRVAERIQVRLHDLGTRLDLTAAAARPDLTLETLPALPGDPGLALVAIAWRFGGPAMGLEALRAVTEAGDDPDALTDLSERLAARLPVLPLYTEPGHVWARPALLGIQSGPAAPVDPAELWRWPLPGPPPADEGR